MSLIPRCSVALLVAVLAAACGKSTGPSSGSSSGSSGGSSGSSLPSAHQRCVTLAAAVCAHDTACGWYDATQTALCEASAGCSNTAAEAVGDGEVDAGRVVISATAYAACQADIASAACTETGAIARAQSANCSSVSTGTSPVNGMCLVSGDCQVRQSTCLRSEAACAGTCASPITSGPCGVGEPGVALGSYCAPDGGAMPQGSAGTTCSVDVDCLPPLRCGGTRGANVCSTPGASMATQPCASNADCASNGVCVWIQTDGTGGVCMVRGGVGAACSLPEPDGGTLVFRDGGARPEAGLSNTGEYCDPGTITCQAQAALGAACNPDAGDPKCLAGSCNAGNCTYAADGANCTRAADCLSGSCILVSGAQVCAHSCP